MNKTMDIIIEKYSKISVKGASRKATRHANARWQDYVARVMRDAVTGGLDYEGRDKATIIARIKREHAKRTTMLARTVQEQTSKTVIISPRKAAVRKMAERWARVQGGYQTRNTSAIAA